MEDWPGVVDGVVARRVSKPRLQRPISLLGDGGRVDARDVDAVLLAGDAGAAACGWAELPLHACEGRRRHGRIDPAQGEGVLSAPAFAAVERESLRRPWGRVVEQHIA